MSREYFFFDIESTGLLPFEDEIHGVAWLQEEDAAVYSPMWDLPAIVAQKLADPTVTKVFHSGERFDPMFFVRKGFAVRGPLLDTLLLYQMLDENQDLGLKDLTIKHLGPQFLKNKKKLDDAIKAAGVKHLGALNKIDLADPRHPYLKVISEYAIEDIENTFRLFHKGREALKGVHEKVQQIWQVKETPLTYFTKEVMPLEPVILGIETNGVRVRMELMEEIKKEADENAAALLSQMLTLCGDKIAAIEESLYQEVLATKVTDKAKKNLRRSDKKQRTAFNWGSGEHLGELFYVQYQAPEDLHARTESGKWCTDEAQINKLMALLPSKHPLVDLLRLFQQWKKIQKTAQTYTGDAQVGVMSHVVDKNGTPYIHPKYLQRPVTGRLSSKDPNFQNMPRNSPVKGFFRPDSDEQIFLYFDYKAVELRVAAHLSQDRALMEAFEEGGDPHRNTAVDVFGCKYEDVQDWQRQAGKTMNFLLIFRGGPGRLHQQLLDDANLDLPQHECKEMIERFFQKYKTLDQYLKDQLEFMRRYHRVITETGRVRRIPEIVYGNFIDYRKREFNGPPELVEELTKKIQGRWRSKQPKQMKHLQPPTPTPEEILNEAGLTYAHAKKMGFNAPVQGLAASICKRAMIALAAKGFVIKSQIHDALILQVKRSEMAEKQAEAKYIMENNYKITVPLEVDCKILESFSEKDALKKI